MLAGWLESEPTAPLLPDGRPRAPLPVFLVEHLRPEHTLKFYSDEAHPLYADDLLVLMGTHLVTGQWSWAAHYDKGDNSNTPWPIDLWNTSGSEIVGGDTASMAAQALQEHLLAWGFKTHIILDNMPEKEKPNGDPPVSPAPQAAPRPVKASKPLPDGVPCHFTYKNVSDGTISLSFEAIFVRVHRGSENSLTP